MKYGRSLPDLANELERQLLTKRDMIVPTQCMRSATDDNGQTSILVEMPDGLKTYGLINAVTGHAQLVDDYDRSTELEAIAGRMLEQSGTEWRAIAEAD